MFTKNHKLECNRSLGRGRISALSLDLSSNISICGRRRCVDRTYSGRHYASLHLDVFVSSRCLPVQPGAAHPLSQLHVWLCDFLRSSSVRFLIGGIAAET